MTPGGWAKRLALWLFQDRASGRVVIAQAPNPALWVFLGALAATYLITPGGAVYAVARTIEHASLAVWAADEIIRGVNPWRRFLGAATLVGGVVLLLKR